jgi:hypothetical protein
MMKSKAILSRLHCPGEDYGISKSICRGRQKAHYPKCPKCDFKTGTVSSSTALTEEQGLGTLTAVKQAKPGLAKKTRKKISNDIKRENTGSIMVKSEPSSATIYLDGDSIGVTPAIIRQILPGTYEISVKKEGYDNWKKLVDVVSSKETSLNAILQGKNGSIIVESEPTNAKIFVDNDYIGVTPAEICQVVPGRYAVNIKKDGYDIWKQMVVVEANKKISLTAILKGKHGAIAIESDPTNAKIYIDGDDKGTTPVTLTDLKPGEYTVTIKHNEYVTWENSVKVQPEKETFITAVLLKKYGSIFLESDPSNANISLDGKNIDTTPARLNTIAYGIHLVEVIKDGYEVWRRNVKVEPGKEKSLTATLQLHTGSVTIESEPTKAMVYLDGKHVGTTPDSFASIVPGTHEINVKLDGHDVWSELVNVEAGKDKLLSASLQKMTGSVMIESEPAKAIIYFDGNKIGETPDIIISSSIGSHLVEVRKDGYNTWTKNIDIEPGKEKTLSAILRAKTGSISINSQPSPAVIIINGKEVGNTPGTITDLISGTYEIEVKKSGYENWHESVEVVADKEISITAALLKTKGAISVISKPPNAEIYLDGEEAGITPDILSSVDIGLHEIELRMKGYAVWKKSINVKHGKEISLSATLQINTGSVIIKSDPAEAKIFINGEEHGITPENITGIKTGMCDVDVMLDGYVPWNKTVKIKPGKEISLIAVLQVITGAIKINSEPPDATFRIDGNTVGTTPKTLNEIIPGKHLVEVSKDGYEIWSNSVEIMPEKEVDITAELKMKPGSVIVNSKPSDAIVFLDEKEISTTPITITDLKPGTHKLDVSMDGYKHWSETINIINGKELSITAELQIKTGSVNIKSEPSDAIVFLDEMNFGNTPIILTDLKPGEHKLEIKVDGYEGWSEVVDIIPDKEVALTAILQIQPGSVSIISKPSEALVFLDDREVGNTPVTITELSPGTYMLEVKTEGYESWSNRVEVIPGKEIALTAKLQTKTGSVNIKSEPSDAIVFLDEMNFGKTPIIITDLRPGKHKLEIKVEGYEDWAENIDIIPENEVALTAELNMKPGTVNIESKPAEAIVFLDEKEFGNTPISITDLQPGTCNVKIKMDGYEDWCKTINIINGKVTSLTAELQILPGSVNIQSEPSDSIVLLGNIESGKTPITIADLTPGIHSVIVKMEGYENWSENIDIKPNEEYAFTAVLRKLTGSISIKSNPSKAKIYLDSKEVGTTPNTLKAIDIGPHEFEIRSDGYTSWMESIDINKGKNKKIHVVLQKNTGSVIIKSEPSNAKVLIDGSEVGNTPVTISDLIPGMHSVAINMEGYEDWSKSLETIAGEETVIAAALQMKTGSICINSKPANAKAIIDGKVVGNTPITISNLKPDTYNVEIKIDGYADWKESIDVIYNKEIAIDADLQIKTGAVCVKSEPSNAKVLIDGNEIGNTPITISDLKPGMHSVDIKMEGYVNWSKSLETIPDEDAVITAELQMEVGSASINSEPINAKVIIDGKVVGDTPITLEDMKPATYNVEVKRDGYVDWAENIDVIANKEVTIDAELQIKTGIVCIKSEPSNSKVLIEGNEVGTTPVTLTDLMPGTFNVEVMMEGYESWEESVNVISDKKISLTVALQMKPGSVSIESEPAEAMVIINDQEVGTTPTTIADLKTGTYNLEVVMDGYEKWINKVEIKSDEENFVTAALQKITGSLGIKSKPANAIIYLDGEEVGSTPYNIESISVGSYEVEISIEGYKSWKQSIKINKGKNKDINAKLQILNGSVCIISEPKDAKVMLDGKKAGNTPVTITDLKPGAYNIEVIMDGYNNWKESIDVIPGNVISLSATLKMKPGAVSITSEPTEATVLLDDKEAGTTPITITDLMPGIHNLEVKMKGYEKWYEQVDVIPDKENSFAAVLRKSTGSISVKSNPINAKLYIDGQEIGTTPNTLKSIEIGSHEFEVVCKGYKSWKKSINIKKGKNTNISAVLQVNTGSVNIKSEPSVAKVLIDGYEVGNTPITITDLKQGMHNVEVRMNGYKDWKENIDIIPDKEIVLTPELLTKVGSIMIESEPADALVLIDDKEAGNTPITITDLKPAMHNVEIRKIGYVSWNKDIDIITDKEISITASLQVKAGSVTIKSEPTTAKVIIDEKEVGNTPVTITDLNPGTHTVKVSVAGYDDWMESVDIIHDKEIIITAALQINTGSISIISEPLDAKVILDDNEAGTTPIAIIDLKSGPHMVAVRKDGYDDWRESVDIKPGKETTLTAKLHKKTGSVSIISDPPGAIAIIDGKEVGVTPKIIADLMPGNHNVEIINDGYLSWNESVNIVPDEEINLAAKLQLKTGAVSIKSEPSNAITLIDGNEIGTTPVTITDMQPGMHNVEVSMTGYENWYEKVDVKSDKENPITATLRKITGSIVIKSKPPKAKIYLDGEDAGITPANLSSVGIGTHEVEVSTDGYTSWKSSIEINKGKNKKINVVLQKSTGSLCIKSNPSNAKVLINGNEIGATPVTKNDLELGTYNVEVMKDGYENWSEEAEIINDKEITLKPVLQVKDGSISLVSEPSGAIIFMDGKDAGTTPLSIAELKPGSHHVEVRMDGYYDWRESVEIIPGKKVELSAVLKFTIGSLNIKSNPTDAEVFIDNKTVGVTPKTITDLRPGTHNVEVRKIGYGIWSEGVNILPDKEIHLTAVLQLGVGSISLKSDPSNAMAFIDGGEVGTTPISITDLKPGIHYLEVRKDGYDDWRESVDIIPGKELPFMVSLQMKAGSMSIMSNPSNAKALIDGKDSGTTPITKADIKPGNYNVEVLKDGYVDWKENVNIAPGKDIELTATLQIMPGSISIKSNPSDAMVLIDGREIGIAPVSISELTPGMHYVDVRMDGYEDWKESVDIIPNKEIKLTPTLQIKVGSVNIESNPLNATILMDGKEIGSTPNFVSDLLPGQHKVKIIKEGYLDWEKDIDIIPDKGITLSATLQIKAGTISVKSDPLDAKVFVDGAETGITPLSITTLKPGTHTLEVRKAGHGNWKENVVVESDKEISIVALLKEITGSINIKSNPLKAKIYLDGEEVGTTPETLSTIPVGPHEFEIKSGGYEEWKKSIVIREGKVKSINVTLQLNVGSISIESYPEKAKIILDGKEVGNAPKRLTDIIVGTHELEVFADGYDTWQRTIRIKAGKEISLTADLKKISDTVKINTKSTIKTAEIPKPIIYESREVESKPEKEEGGNVTPPQEAKTSSSKSNKKIKYQPDELLTLRSKYVKFTDSQIDSLPKISIREKNNSIFFCHSNISHCFELKPIADGEVVIDHATELMWHQSGSKEYFNLKKAIKWIKMANKKKYASFNDWRLPTLEEASSLLEHEMKNGYFIDPVFDKRQWGTWTGDKNGRSNAWIVTFVNGTVSQTPVGADATFVRPVRSFVSIKK